jgi:hypothetical protein
LLSLSDKKEEEEEEEAANLFLMLCSHLKPGNFWSLSSYRKMRHIVV